VKIKRLHIGLLLALILCWSCVYHTLEKPKIITEEEEKCAIPMPDTISFSKDIQPIFTNNCAIPNCHSGTSPEGNLNLESMLAYSQITQPRKGYLDTKEPTYSLLYNSLTSPANLMPPTGKMVDCKIDLIVKWMGQGAKNN
jgi:hypothetical protein